jgi:hypothetical protein
VLHLYIYQLQVASCSEEFYHAASRDLISRGDIRESQRDLNNNLCMNLSERGCIINHVCFANFILR